MRAVRNPISLVRKLDLREVQLRSGLVSLKRLTPAALPPEEDSADRKEAAEPDARASWSRASGNLLAVAW